MPVELVICLSVSQTSPRSLATGDRGATALHETGRESEVAVTLLLRSLLFVPGDRPDRFAKAAAAGADAAIVDLEDSVPRENKAAARDAVRAWLTDGGGRAWVRVNPADDEHHEADLD